MEPSGGQKEELQRAAPGSERQGDKRDVNATITHRASESLV